jgi:hypothetical protein
MSHNKNRDAKLAGPVIGLALSALEHIQSWVYCLKGHASRGRNREFLNVNVRVQLGEPT